MPIDIQGGDYEHVLALREGQGGPEFVYRKADLSALSLQVLNGGTFDVAEYSMANHIMICANGGARPWQAIPVFPSRAFRNVSIFVARASALVEIGQLRGKRVAVSEFAMTTAIWTRGQLHDQFGLDWRELEWVTGPKPRFATPTGVRATHSSASLEELVVTGEVDALIAGRPKDTQRPAADRRLRVLVRDPDSIERAYFEQTGLFPIMHTLVLHPRVLTDPGMPGRLFKAYAVAKQSAWTRRLGATMMPFAERLWDRYRFDGDDPMRYGLTDLNRKNIQTLARYLREQGFIEHEPTVDSLFLPGSAAWSDA